MKNEQHTELLQNIKNKFQDLAKLHMKITDHFNEEYYMYRYYHHSFKAYYIQDSTKEIYDILASLAPEGCSINKMAKEIVEKGINKSFKMDHNKNWNKHLLPMIQAFYHMKFFLEMTIKYSNLEDAPEVLPMGWAALLHFYNIR